MAAYVAFALITRHIAGDDPPLVTLFMSIFAGTLLGIPFAASDWRWDFPVTTWGLLLSLGVFGGAGHYLFILAYRLAPAGIVTPFIYMQIVSMAALGYIVFDDVPDVWTFVGSTVVVASGIYLSSRRAGCEIVGKLERVRPVLGLRSRRQSCLGLLRPLSKTAIGDCLAHCRHQVLVKDDVNP